MTSPLISIVTPCMNRAEFVREAVDSVLSQNYPNFEHIIVDGGSTDGTLDILRSYPHLKVVSEPDQGIFDALNKGIKMAHGDIIGWLNTDDFFAENIFRAVVETFQSAPEALAVAGGADKFVEENGTRRVTRTHIAFREDKDFWDRIVESPVTNAWFFRPAIFQKVGYFNIKYRLTADRDFFIRATLAGVRAVPIFQNLYHYRQHFGSATLSEDPRIPDRASRLVDLLSEALVMLEVYLDRKDFPPVARKAARRLHSEQAAQYALVGLYHREFKHAWEAISAGWRYDPTWPFYFARRAIRRSIKEARHEV
jgi:glycosyltransferase involved in cell wall biosynthesis